MKTDTTLFGQQVLTVQFEDGAAGEITVRQLKLREYPAAVRLWGDEFAFAALCCGVTAAQLQTLLPADYERVQAAVQEVNQEGFFIFAARQEKRAAENLKNLPPEMVEKILSSRLSATLPPPAA